MTTAVRAVPVLGPALALAAVAALDLVLRAHPWPKPVVGLLDEPAHLLTAWLLLTALGFRFTRGRTLAAWALVGSVAIDVDHIPLYLWSEPVALPGSRPVTHSLATVALLLLVAAATTRGARTAAVGLALGVSLHLVRDVVSAPGIPLLWPATGANAQLPYGWYLAVLAVATALAMARTRSGFSAGDR